MSSRLQRVAKAFKGGTVCSSRMGDRRSGRRFPEKLVAPRQSGGSRGCVSPPCAGPRGPERQTIRWTDCPVVQTCSRACPRVVPFPRGRWRIDARGLQGASSLRLGSHVEGCPAIRATPAPRSNLEGLSSPLLLALPRGPLVRALPEGPKFEPIENDSLPAVPVVSNQARIESGCCGDTKWWFPW